MLGESTESALDMGLVGCSDELFDNVDGVAVGFEAAAAASRSDAVERNGRSLRFFWTSRRRRSSSARSLVRSSELGSELRPRVPEKRELVEDGDE